MIWKDEYKIGVEAVDRQHQELFERLNSFIKSVRSDRDLDSKKAEVAETLEFMGKYVDVHFTSEEKLQQEYDFPGYPEHHQIHEHFKQEIQKFQKEYQENEYDEEFVMEFSGRLLTWLINHVTDTDQKIGEHINRVRQEKEDI